MNQCKRCGKCCRYLKIELMDITHELVEYLTAHGCSVTGNFVSVPLKCPNLQVGKNLSSCKIQHNKPKLCREYACDSG